MDGGGVGHGGAQLGDGAGADMDVEILVGVEHHQPVGPSGGEQRGDLLIGIELRLAVGGRGGAQVAQQAALGEQIEQGGGIVDAIVGADDQVGEADMAMIDDPFEQERPLVAHGRDEGGGRVRHGGGHGGWGRRGSRWWESYGWGS